MGPKSSGFRWIPLLILSTAVVFSACAPAKTVRKSGTGGDTTVAGDNAGVKGAPGVEVSEADIHNGSEFATNPELATIRFDYDAYSLGDEARQALRKNADYLKANPDLEVLVAGNCDERGTTEYNLALGQKRAKEVREYYLRLGIAPKSVATISYGKESLLCKESTEECWSANRRAETRVRARTASTGGGAQDASTK